MKIRFRHLVVVALMASIGLAQEGPRVTTVDPLTGKAGDNLTVSGGKLGKESVKAVFLSDNDTDHKGTVVEQSEEKIIFKVPEVKPGDYNVAIQVGNNIYIQPVRFKVQ